MEQKSKYDVGNGIHRVPTWRIAGYALNNLATNMYMMMMMYIAYFITGWVGLGVVLAGSFSMIMRIWDGVTDPFIGFVVDRTNGKFGKNRPFMIAGNLILGDTESPRGCRENFLVLPDQRGLLHRLHVPVRCHQVRADLHDKRPEAAPAVLRL